MSPSPLCWRTLDDDCCQLSRSYGESAIGAIASRSMPRGSASPVALATSTRAGVVRRVLDLEKGIASHRVVDFLREIERRQLQQSHCMLQPRGDSVLLALARLEGLKAHRSWRRSVVARGLRGTPGPRLAEDA